VLLAMVPMIFGGIWMGNENGDGAASAAFFLLLCGLCLAVLWVSSSPYLARKSMCAWSDRPVRSGI